LALYWQKRQKEDQRECGLTTYQAMDNAKRLWWS